MAIEEVSVYEYGAGSIIDPKSDTKTVFIPSPPTKIEQKINPRPAIILFGDFDVEALKSKADAEKIVFVLPSDADEDVVKATCEFVIDGAKKLNVVADEVSVQADDAHMEAAQAFVDYAIDELDKDLDDASTFNL